jgi:hypothetical protein
MNVRDYGPLTTKSQRMRNGSLLAQRASIVLIGSLIRQLTNAIDLLACNKKSCLGIKEFAGQGLSQDLWTIRRRALDLNRSEIGIQLIGASVHRSSLASDIE